jgi:hypothetical protein
VVYYRISLCGKNEGARWTLIMNACCVFFNSYFIKQASRLVKSKQRLPWVYSPSWSCYIYFPMSFGGPWHRVAFW